MRQNLRQSCDDCGSRRQSCHDAMDSSCVDVCGKVQFEEMLRLLHPSRGVSFIRSASVPAAPWKYEVVAQQSYEDFHALLVQQRLSIINDVEHRVQGQIDEGMKNMQSMMEKMQEDAARRAKRLNEADSLIETLCEEIQTITKRLQEVQSRVEEIGATKPEGLESVQNGLDEFKKSIAAEVESVKKQMQSVTSHASSVPGSETSSRSTSQSGRKRPILFRRAKDSSNSGRGLQSIFRGMDRPQLGGFNPTTGLSAPGQPKNNSLGVLQKQLASSTSKDSSVSQVSQENYVSDASDPDDAGDTDTKRRRSSSPCWRIPSSASKSIPETALCNPDMQPRASMRQSISASSGGSTDPKVALPFTVSDVEVVEDGQDSMEELSSRLQRHVELSLIPIIASAAGVSESEVASTQLFLQSGYVHIDMLLNVPSSRTWSSTALALRCQRQAVSRQASDLILAAVQFRKKGRQLLRSIQGSTLSGEVCVRLIQGQGEESLTM